VSDDIAATTTFDADHTAGRPPVSRVSQPRDQLQLNKADLTELIKKLTALPRDLYPCGSLGPDVLKGILRHCPRIDIAHSLETGCGKSTLLLSHLSRNHKVFVVPDRPSGGGWSQFETTRSSPYLHRDSVEFIEGPSQRTLPQYRFEHEIDVAFIDGPHGYPFPELEYYTIYRLLNAGGILIVDDIQIPTIRNLFGFLKADEMFSLIEVVNTTAFFHRTAVPTFDPFGDGWWLQNYNQERDRIGGLVPRLAKMWIPKSIKRSIKSAINSVIEKLR
jgi:hypothetical protein